MSDVIVDLHKEFTDDEIDRVLDWCDDNPDNHLSKCYLAVLGVVSAAFGHLEVQGVSQDSIKGFEITAFDLRCVIQNKILSICFA